MNTRQMRQHLRFTDDGTVWADWILHGVPYRLLDAKSQHAAVVAHQLLLRSLRGEALLMGINVTTSPAAVVEQMLRGHSGDDDSEWAQECAASLPQLENYLVGDRIYYLSVPLASTGIKGLHRIFSAQLTRMSSQLGFPPPGISDSELQRHLKAAAAIERSIPAVFDPKPATPAHMAWLHHHNLRRGTSHLKEFPACTTAPPKSGSALRGAIFDEAGQSDATTATDRLQLAGRRYLKIFNDDDTTSYQAVLAISDVPDEGVVFPGGEMLGRIDEFGLDVDWALRLSINPGTSASSANRKALVELNEQFDQHEAEVSHQMSSLQNIADNLAEYVAILERDRLEVEIKATLMFAVGAATSDDVVEISESLRTALTSMDYRLVAPLGNQCDMWWALQPGVPTPAVARDYAQICPSATLAHMVPLMSHQLGSDSGSLLGINITDGPLQDEGVTCGMARPVLLDIEGASDKMKGAAIAVAGEMGAGKALALDTPIPTPTGWTQMGALMAGDMVFDDQGRPTQVLGTSPVMFQHECYRVTFSDGTSIVADAEHLWNTVASPGLAGEPRWHEHAATLTTAQILDTLSTPDGRPNHWIPTAEGLSLPTAALPVEPAVVGAWLGGIETTDSRTRCLLSAIIDPDAPAIPAEYLRASMDQRAQLVTCLLGAAGCWGPNGGPNGSSSYSFDTPHLSLASSLRELARTLGQQTALTHDADRGVWTVAYDEHVGLARSIVDVQPVASVPVRCIQVAAPSHLFLAGPGMVPTHNTATLMKLAGDVIDRDGHLIVVDRTEKGEWASWATSLTDVQVADPADPMVSLDPLRLFGVDGSRMAMSFLVTLLRIRVVSEQGTDLAELLSPDYLEAHGLSSMGDLLAHLGEGSCALENAGQLRRMMNVFAKERLGRIVFDGSLPVADPQVGALIVRTHKVSLPTQDELHTPHLFDELGPDKMLGRALHALVAQLARTVMFADTSRLGGFVVSEAHSLTSSQETIRTIEEFIRDGRKHRATMLIDSQDAAADFGSTTLRGLIPTRLQMRQPDATLAQGGLEWLGLDADDPDLLRLVQGLSPLEGQGSTAPHRMGEALMRDMHEQYGLVKVLLPAREHRRAAITAGGTAAARKRAAG